MHDAFRRGLPHNVAAESSLRQGNLLKQQNRLKAVPLWFTHLLVVTRLKTRNWASQPDDDLRCSIEPFHALLAVRGSSFPDSCSCSCTFSASALSHCVCALIFSKLPFIFLNLIAFLARKPSSLFCLLHRLLNECVRSCSHLFLLESHEDIVRAKSPDTTFHAVWVLGPVALLPDSVANSPNATKARLASRTVGNGRVVTMVDGDRSHHVLTLGGPRTRVSSQKSQTMSALLSSGTIPAPAFSSSATAFSTDSHLAKK
jgi:hypothetical protein